jgi:hypothetical protein
MSMTVPTHCNLDLPNVSALLEAGLQIEVPQQCQWKILWGFANTMNSNHVGRSDNSERHTDGQFH